VTVVMGLDQHRAQITAEWLDTETGEVSRARVMPADRDGVRRFLSRFADRQVEVALEAATGWRFVVEEIRAIGAQAHLAEPASALKGNKKRAKTDRADARQVVAPVRDDARAREAGAVDLPETSLGDPPIRRDR
jgi:transposase